MPKDSCDRETAWNRYWERVLANSGGMIRQGLSSQLIPIFWEFPNDLGIFFGKKIGKCGS